MDKRILGFLAVCGVGVLLLFSNGQLQAKRHFSGLSTNSRGAINSCSDLEFNFDDQVARVAEQHFTAPRSAAPLQVEAAHNGGVEVIGWDGTDYSISACKAAATDSLLKEISVSVKGNSVTSDGPGGSDWTVYLILKAPKDSNLSIEARNGPIALRQVSGKVDAHSVNGPISVEDCSGDIEARTQNGPISMSGRGGNQELETQNGPISVALAGNRWGSGKVNAHTQNGPLSLEVPENYLSGVRVEMSGHSPVTCHAAQCNKSGRTWDDENRYIEFGDATPSIHMSTVNGPVSVDSGGAEL
jgi:DUF4097 and DUF4098 domain-containing protein YvlB